MSDTLHKKVVLIAGATGALGSALVGEFAQTEAQLALTSTSPQKLEQLATEIGLTEERVFTVVADVTQADKVQDLMAAVVAHFGRVDVLLNTVGGWSGGRPVEKTSVEEWNQMLTLNLHSVFLLSRAALPTMLEAGWESSRRARAWHVGPPGRHIRWRPGRCARSGQPYLPGHADGRWARRRGDGSSGR